jgi:hypothetical protein
MGSIKNQFIESWMFQRLKTRAFTMAQIVGYLEEEIPKHESNWIIETGCARIKDNWEGDGQSTLVWDWLISKFDFLNATSIDLIEEHCELAKKEAPKVIIQQGDSIIKLNELHPIIVKNCRLLYLDSYDWAPETQMDSAYHHLSELMSVWARLPQGCLIVVDDRKTATLGKHQLIAPFMDHLGIKPVFVETQIGWIKP